MATAALSVVALAILYAAVFWAITSSAKQALAAAVDTDLAGLADIYASGGRDELLTRLQDRQDLVSVEPRRAYYLLANDRGQRIAGSLQQWPALDARRSERGYVVLDNGVAAYARATRLAPDLQLLVARDRAADDAQLRQISITFALMALAILVTAWLLGQLAGRRLMRRIVRITQALKRGDQADLDEETARAFASDEIGLLARTSGQLIERANRLAQTHRHMSDHVAHEIRTPLMHLDNRLFGAIRELPDDAELKAQLNEGRTDIRSIAMLLDSLLDIAASEARRGDATGLVSVNLSALAKDLVDLYQGSMEDAGLTISSMIPADVIIQGEPMQLTRLLSNLLDNAIKYVPAGGQVTLTLESGPKMIVADNGPGIDPALVPHLFERFRRGAVHSPRGGHGLGLALAKAICERHGLSIRAEDNRPGTKFVIEPEMTG